MIETIRGYIFEIKKLMIYTALTTFGLMILFYFAGYWGNELIIIKFAGIMGMIFSLCFGVYLGLLIAIELIKKEGLD